jgi:AcrR family transcriptional regulator
MPRTTNKRNHILQAALELFARHGYKGTSINMIATEIGVSQSLLYNFFESKENLLTEIMNLAFDDIQKSMVPYNVQSDPANALKEHVRATCKIIKLRSDFWRLIHAVRLQEGLPGVLMESYRTMVKHVTAIFRDVFTKLGYDHPQLEALLFLSQIDGMVIMYLQDEHIPIDRLGEQLIKRYKS